MTSGVVDGSRYTQRVSWKRPVSILALAILTGLPVLGTVCGLLCAYDTADASMALGHHSGHHHVSTAVPNSSSDGRIDGVSDADCVHDGALLQAFTIAAERADRGVVSVPTVTAGLLLPAAPLHESGPHVEYRAPGTAPPTASLPVLRI